MNEINTYNNKNKFLFIQIGAYEIQDIQYNCVIGGGLYLYNVNQKMGCFSLSQRLSYLFEYGE